MSSESNKGNVPATKRENMKTYLKNIDVGQHNRFIPWCMHFPSRFGSVDLEAALQYI